jgi:hypothetical protein
VHGAAREYGLYVHERLAAIPSPIKGVLFSVWTLGTEAKPFVEREPFVARTESGARTAQALALRSFFGLPNPVDEIESPQLRARGGSPRVSAR